MKQFKPYIPADKVMPELTPTSAILGIILAVVFGGANAYLGLRVGMTVSASIPAAVLSMGIVRMIMRRDSILEIIWCRRSALQVNLWPPELSLRCQPCSCGQMKIPI